MNLDSYFENEAKDPGQGEGHLVMRVPGRDMGDSGVPS